MRYRHDGGNDAAIDSAAMIDQRRHEGTEQHLRHNRRMDISCTVSYQAAPEKAADVLMSKELADARAHSLGISHYSYEGDTAHASVSMSVRAAQLPEKARSFIKNDVRVTVTMKRSQAEDAACDYEHASVQEENIPITIAYEAKIQGIPVKTHGSISLSPHESGATTAHVAGSLSVTLPFIGKKIEAMAGAHVHTLFEKDAQLVNRLLSGQ